MKVEYSARSLTDLRKIAASSRREFGDQVAAALESRIRTAVQQLRSAPESAPRVEQRPGVRVLSLVRYPYRIFYRFDGESIRILHIRHVSRRQWRISG
jgi:plasmid stabilization system protein ParE